MGLMGVALSQCIILLSLNAVFSPWYISRVSKLNMWLYWREQGIGLGCGVVIALMSYYVNFLLHPQSMGKLVISLAISTVLGLLVLLPFGLRALRQKQK
jgi:hypothetical protein